MAVNTPLFLLKVPAVDAVIVFDERVGREAGTKYRRDVFFRPAHDVDQWFPERFLVQRRVDDIGTRDYQCIESLFGQLFEFEIVFLDMLTGFLAALYPRHRKWIDEKLRDGIAAADQTDELPLGRGERRVRHHVEKADMQLTNVLLLRAVEGQDNLAAITQDLECGQTVVGD